jgi:hypothetical protein
MSYTGELDTNLRRHGRGTYNYNNTSFKYTGNFHRGIKQGQGSFLICGGQYEGSFENGEITGTGKRTWDSGTQYEGEFVMGEMHGQGRMSLPTGESYVGLFFQNKRHGAGELTSPDGTVYQGTFESHKKHGEGIEYLPGGATFTGIWSQGKRHGAGTLAFPGGECLKATWNNGEINPEAEGGAEFHDANAQYSYNGSWLKGQPTEAGVGEIVPKGAGITVSESTDDDDGVSRSEAEPSTVEPSGKRWISSLGAGDRLTDWTFQIKTTKQLDKKTRILPEKGRTVEITTWLVAPVPNEDDDEGVTQAVDANAGTDAGTDENEEILPGVEKFVPVQTRLFIVVPKEDGGEEEEGNTGIDGGTSALAAEELGDHPTCITVEIDEKGVACLPTVDVNVDTAPGTYAVKVRDSTKYGKGSLSLGFVLCDAFTILVSVGVDGGGSKGGSKKKKKKK